MLNYHKTYRESLDKAKRRPTPKKQPTINRSHTSSINLKLSSDLDQMKGSIKNLKQNNDPSRKQSINHSKSKSNIKNDHTVSTSQFKYSFKIKQDSDYYDGSRVRMKTNYEQSNCIKPFRESNRCLITQRNQKSSEYKFNDKSQSKKNQGHLRTEYKQKNQHRQKSQYKEKGQYLQNCEQQDLNRVEFCKLDENELKMRKQLSTKHNTQSINSNSSQAQLIKVPINQLKKLIDQFKHYEHQVSELQKQLSFYRKNAAKQSKNSILLALAQ